MASIKDIEIQFKTKGESEFVASAKRMKQAADDISKGTSGATRQARQDVDQLAGGFSNLQKGILTTAAAISTFRGAASAFRFVIQSFDDLAQAAYKVAGVEASFKSFQASIGQLSDVMLGKLRAATQGMVSDLNLMQKANQALLLGLPLEKFDKLAEGAVKLGRAMGIDALQGIDALTIGVGRQSRLVLDNIGIIVKADEAYRKWALSHGILNRELDDNEKKLAFQAEAFAKIEEKSSSLSLSIDDVGTSAAVLRSSWENLTKAFLESYNTNKDLTEANKRLGGELNNAQQAAKDAGEAIAGLEANAKNLIASFLNGEEVIGGFAAKIATAFESISPQGFEKGFLLKSLLGESGQEQADPMAKFLDSIVANLQAKGTQIKNKVSTFFGGLVDNFKESRGEFGKNKSAFADILDLPPDISRETLGKFDAVFSQLKSGVISNKEALEKIDFISAVLPKDKVPQAVDYIKEKLQEVKRAHKEAAAEGDKAARAAERIATRISRLTGTEPGAEFQKEGQGLFLNILLGGLSPEEANAKVTELASKIGGGVGDVFVALDRYESAARRQFDDLNQAAKQHGDEIRRVVEEYEKLTGKKITGLVTETDAARFAQANKNLQSGAFPSEIKALFKDDIANLTDTQLKNFEKFSGAVQKFAIIGDAINQAGQALGAIARGISSGSFGKIKNAAGTGAAIGSAGGAIAGGIIGSGVDLAVPGLGTALGVMLGSQLGSQGGGMIGELVAAIHTTFSSDTPGSKARKAVDKWFTELFDVERLGAVINGQVNRIQDVVFQGNSPFGGNVTGFAKDNNGFDALKNLGSQAQQGFGGVGAAMESLLGVTEDISGQIAAMLANNIGGSLENLQLLVQQTGYSFEQMGEALLQSFYDGRLSIQELYNDLRGLQDVFTEGIPGQIGAVGEAFANLQASLADGKGSRLMLDSIRDLGAEAQELGINTLPNLASAMVNQFGIAADKVAAIMEAMKVAGIGSVKDLLDASISTIAAVAANIDSLTKGQAAVAVGITDPTQVEGRTPPTLFSPAKYAEGKKEKAGKNEILEQVNAIKGILSASESYQKVVSDLASGLISKKEALKASNIEYKAAARLVSEQTKLEKELEAETKKGKKASQERMQNLLLGLSQVNKKISEFGKGIKLGDGELIGQLDELAKKMSNFFDIGAAAASAGVGLDNLTNSVTELFKRGSIGAEEALQKYLQYKEALEGGVLGKTGAVGEAIDKLISTGADAGTLSIQAFKGILTEGKEANLGTLGDFYEKFKEKLGVPAAEALRDSLNAEKIFNFEDFSKVSDDAIVRLLGRMKELKFPFQETSNETKKLLDQITQIGKLGPQYVDVILKVKTQYDSSTTKKIAQQGNINLKGEGVAQR